VSPGDPALLSNGVNLVRLDANANSQPIKILGVMHDDGVNGDAVANDGIFTLQFTANEPAKGQIVLQCAAAFRGLARRFTAASATYVPVVPVGPPQPTILSVVPGFGLQGQQGLSVTVTGQATHFTQGITTASFGVGITASLTVNSPTSATALLNIDPAAPLGQQDVTLNTGNEVVTLKNGFTVGRVGGPPTISDFNPKSGPIGTLVTVTGANLQPNAGTAAQVTLAKQGGGTINSPVSSATGTTLSFVIPAGAATGTLKITVNSSTASSGSPLTIVPSSSFTFKHCAVHGQCDPRPNRGVCDQPDGHKRL
jgi:hypothetical protein